MVEKISALHVSHLMAAASPSVPSDCVCIIPLSFVALEGGLYQKGVPANSNFSIPPYE